MMAAKAATILAANDGSFSSPPLSCWLMGTGRKAGPGLLAFGNAGDINHYLENDPIRQCPLP